MINMFVLRAIAIIALFEVSVSKIALEGETHKNNIH